jgi:LysM repeat protein
LRAHRVAFYPATAAVTCPAGTTAYVVKAGDWVRRIARQFNVDWRNIVTLNALSQPNLIYPGQTLCLPPAATLTITPTRRAIMPIAGSGITAPTRDG